MATYNTYIGARYVPIFADPIEWDKAKSYEPLTIVTYQGDSYTSKTFVPAQTEITNTEFWVRTGSYNAQVEQYRKEVQEVVTKMDDLEESVNNSISSFDTRLTQTEEKVESYNNRITTLESDNTTNKANISNNTNSISTIEGQINTINTEIESLDSRVESNENSISTINENLTNLSNLVKNRRFIVIGDSYCDGTNSWIKSMQNYLGKNDTDYVKSYMGGAGFAHGNKNFLNLLQEANATNPNTITDIIVCGGANNYPEDTDTILNGTGGIQEFVNYAKSTYQNATVHIGFIGVNLNNNDNMPRAINAYKQCTKFGAKYLNNVEFILPSYTLLKSDFIHPNEQGDYQLGVYITNAVLTGSCDVNYSYEKLNIVNESYISSITGGFASYRQNNVERLVSTGIGVYFSQPQQITANDQSKVKVATIQNGSFIGTAFATYTCAGLIYDGSKFRDIPITIIIDKNEIIFSFNGASDDGAAWFEGTVNRILINQINLISQYY